MEFCQKLQQLRKQNSLTQEQLAALETRRGVRKLRGTVCAALDLAAVSLVILPLFSQREVDFIRMVPLAALSGVFPAVLLSGYWAILLGLIVLGLVQLVAGRFEREDWRTLGARAALGLSIFGVCYFTATREPYATTLLFLLLVAKGMLLSRRDKLKK